ncbi:hypothetical protein M9H77_23458 [Catharanthus roseus]|uniref:Uncharacterized protein n=1 Tax=Catharanthus roseus TaxID=4058 RepID=A0ACC0ATE2_CATRO|nr:hypothetical protein M9H77_23458 [Catharanthus roseus]
MREGRGNFKPHLNRVITPWKMRYMKNERQAVRRGSKSNPGARIPLLDSRKVVIKAPRATLQSFLPRILFWKEKLIETTLKFDNVVEVQTTLNLAHDRPIILGVHRLSPNETSYITKIILRHLRLFQANEEDILCQIRSCYQEIDKEKSNEVPYALILDGKALEIALKSHDDTKQEFLQLAVCCDSVICCRVSPKQKALMTRLVKEYTGKTTLAIGDGANDVGMIQEADIGVGISGMEGMQAVMASDFSLPQFCFLERLIIVHGHWCYKRISKMILYFVYKNIAFGLTLFYNEIYSKFCGDDLYDDWYMVLFNVLLTSLPVISLGVLDQDVSSDVCLQFPALYQQGQRNVCFSWKRIIGWISNGILSSISIFIITIYTLSPSAFKQDGNAADLTHIGTIMYTCLIWTVNCQIALIISHFTWISHFLIWGSILFWYIFLALYGSLPPQYSSVGGEGFHLLIEAIGSAPMYWMITLLVVLVSLLPYFVHIVMQRSFYPMDDQIIQEIKCCRKDITDDNPMWLREQHKSQMMKTRVGFSARVEAKIRQIKGRFNQKKKSIYKFVTHSPGYANYPQKHQKYATSNAYSASNLIFFGAGWLQPTCNKQDKNVSEQLDI